MQPITVDDDSDPRLADYLDLRDPHGRLRYESTRGCFVVEGFTAIGRLLQSAHRVRSVLVLPKYLPRLAELLGERDVAVYAAERPVLAAVAGFDLHRGIVASADRPAPLPPEQVLGGPGLVVALQGLNDPENLGSIARTSRAFGATALLLDPTCADPWARRTVRVSMGEILHLPVARADHWDADLAAARAAGFTVAALTPRPSARSIWDVPVTERMVAMFGAEGPGLSDESLAAADLLVRIPISPQVDSLNVGHAVAVTLAAFTSGRA